MSKHPQLQKYLETWNLLLTEGIKLLEYKLLTQRRYANPRGYQKFDRVAQTMAAHIFGAYHLPWEVIKSDFAVSNNTTLSFQIAQTQAPVYWLSPSLLESILYSDLPKWISAVKRPVQLGILMLPENTIYSPDREAIDYIAFRHTLAQEIPPVVSFNGQKIVVGTKDNDYILCTTATRTGTVYATNFGLQMSEEEDALSYGESHFEAYNALGIELDENAENNFLRLMESIVLQALLLMQLQPQIVTTSSLTQSVPGLGFGKLKLQKEPNEIWSPNWIGKDYQKRQTQATATSTAHASPRPHWRRGHFRRVAVGPREQNQRQWQWFEPAYVNAPK